MEEISNYLVKNPKQITNYLNTLSKEKCLISAVFGENNSFLTAILDIDEKKQTIIIDCGPKEYLNKELLNAGLVDCSADFNGIKVIFKGRQVKKAGKPSNPALSIQIPDLLYWVQRRQFYRVRSPLSKNSYCRIPLQETENETLQSFNFKLFNLSVSGFSITVEELALVNKITLNLEFTNCHLILNETETHAISFIPRNIIPINPNNPSKGHRIGCEFIDITPREENAFARYMQAIEREIKKNFD